MTLKTQGQITFISPVVQSGKFRYRNFALRTEGGNQHGLQLTNNKVYTIDDFKVGDTIHVEFQLIGKQRGGKVFNNLLVDTIQMVDDAGTQKEKRAAQSFQKMKDEKRFE